MNCSYQVTAQVSVKTVDSASPSFSNATQAGDAIQYNEDANFSNWMTFQEPISTWANNSFTSQGILEHLNVTKDISDYLWYSTR